MSCEDARKFSMGGIASSIEGLSAAAQNPETGPSLERSRPAPIGLHCQDLFIARHWNTLTCVLFF